MRFVWTSDIHLNHAALAAWESWIGGVRKAEADALVISGDISEADDVEFQLRRIAEEIRLPIYFVLGNHDFYCSSIAATRQTISSLSREVKSLTYLTDCQPIMLDEQTFLVGEDGWGDGTHGDFANSHVQLNDFRLIKDFRQLQGDQWLSEMVRLGEESADRLSQKLNELSSEARKLFVLTHVPPYRKACLYEGLPADDDWAPFFVCGQIGDVLSRFAATRTDLQINVLCGHTHHRGDILIAPNLRVRTAAAEYAHPRIEQVIETTKTDAH